MMPPTKPQQHPLNCLTCNKPQFHVMGLARCPVTGELIGPNDPQRKMVDLLGCASHSANTGAQNKAEGVAQISSYNYIKDIAAAKGMSFYDLVNLVVDDLKAQARIDAVAKELEQKAAAHRKEAKRRLQPMLSARALGVEEAIALLKEGVGK